jgi:hypothetical protein
MPLWGFEVGESGQTRTGERSGIGPPPLRAPTDPEDDGPGLTCRSRIAIGRSPI